MTFLSNLDESIDEHSRSLPRGSPSLCFPSASQQFPPFPSEMGRERGENDIQVFEQTKAIITQDKHQAELDHICEGKGGSRAESLLGNALRHGLCHLLLFAEVCQTSTGTSHGHHQDHGQENGEERESLHRLAPA